MNFPPIEVTKEMVDNYLLNRNEDVKEICNAELDLKVAKGKIIAFRSEFSKDHYAIIINPQAKSENSLPLLRVHSSCFTGDLLASLKCDCFDQLQNAIKIMHKEEGGVIIYLNQEGRGIGLTNKVSVYNAQSMGLDTVEANENLGFEADSRCFSIAAKILKHLGINKAKLLSNNPSKAIELVKGGVEIESTISHQFFQEKIVNYYKVKAQKFNHNIKIKT
jgi:GTP cyclohydrolase II